MQKKESDKKLTNDVKQKEKAEAERKRTEMIKKQTEFVISWLKRKGN